MILFEKGISARAIEHGAEIYDNYCSRCHGRKGFGIVGHGPALNNPQLFGHDYFPLLTEKRQLIYVERKALREEQSNDSTTDQRKLEINSRLQEIDLQLDILTRDQNQLIKPAIDHGYRPEYFNRLAEIDWQSSLKSFISTTLVHGRPVSSNYWPQAMPAYSIEASSGIVLTTYELEDVTAYIMNWDKGDAWTLEDLYAVNQFAIRPWDIDPTIFCLDCPPRPLPPPPVGSNVEAITKKLMNIVGDAERGNQLYHALIPASWTGSLLPCVGCHQQTINGIAPMTNGTYSRVVNERLQEIQFAGYTPKQYLIESIVLPSHYLVPGYKNLMPGNFGNDILAPQDLADILAYLVTQK